MSFDRTKLYLVLNENPYSVYFPTRNGGVMIDAARDGVPTPYQAYFDDILSANSASDIFRDGTLFFEEVEQAAIYAELRIADWESIWHNADIEKMLADPSMDDLKRIIDPKARHLFNRVRGVYVGMRNAGEEISQKARSVVDARQKELENGVTVSRIGIAPKKEVSEDVEELKKQVAALAAKLDQPSAPAPAPVPTTEPEPVQTAKPAKKPAKPRDPNAPKKSPGRPKKAKTE